MYSSTYFEVQKVLRTSATTVSTGSSYDDAVSTQHHRLQSVDVLIDSGGHLEGETHYYILQTKSITNRGCLLALSLTSHSTQSNWTSASHKPMAAVNDLL